MISSGGWDFDVDAALGADFGRVAGQVGTGEELDHNRIPLLVSVLLNVPLWAAFIGVPLLAARTRGLDWRRDMGWGMAPIDVPVGLVIGVATQLALVPLLYLPILHFVDDADVEGPARNLVAAATSPVGVVALVVLTVIGAPIAEEILFRGVLHRGIADMETGRRFGPVVAVVASSAIFAASHLQVLQFPRPVPHRCDRRDCIARHRTSRHRHLDPHRLQRDHDCLVAASPRVTARSTALFHRNHFT